MEKINHYKWLDKHLDSFWMLVFNEQLCDSGCAGIISSHGDKGYQYRDEWNENGIPFPHGMALYMLTYTNKMDKPKHESCEWVIENYPKYKTFLPEIDETDKDIIDPFYVGRL